MKFISAQWKIISYAKKYTLIIKIIHIFSSLRKTK